MFVLFIFLNVFLLCYMLFVKKKYEEILNWFE